MRTILTLRGSSEVYRADSTQSTKFLSFPFKHMKMRCIHPRSLAAHVPQNSHHHPKWKKSSSNLQPSLCGWPACKNSGDVSCIYNIHIRTNWMPLLVMDTGLLLKLLRIRGNKPVLSPSSMFEYPPCAKDRKGMYYWKKQLMSLDILQNIQIHFLSNPKQCGFAALHINYWYIVPHIKQLII